MLRGAFDEAAVTAHPAPEMLAPEALDLLFQAPLRGGVALLQGQGATLEQLGDEHQLDAELIGEHLEATRPEYEAQALVGLHRVEIRLLLVAPGQAHRFDRREAARGGKLGGVFDRQLFQQSVARGRQEIGVEAQAGFGKLRQRRRAAQRVDEFAGRFFDEGAGQQPVHPGPRPPVGGGFGGRGKHGRRLAGASAVRPCGNFFDVVYFQCRFQHLSS